MQFSRPVRPRGCEPRRTPERYDVAPLRATNASATLATRRAVLPPFALFLTQLPWYAWAAMVGALCVGALVGGLWAWDEAERGFYVGQAPTLARIRGRVDRLRSHFARLRVDRHGSKPDMWGEFQGIERDLLDLTPPSRVTRQRGGDV